MTMTTHSDTPRTVLITGANRGKSTQLLSLVSDII